MVKPHRRWTDGRTDIHSLSQRCEFATKIWWSESDGSIKASNSFVPLSWWWIKNKITSNFTTILREMKLMGVHSGRIDSKTSYKFGKWWWELDNEITTWLDEEILQRNILKTGLVGDSSRPEGTYWSWSRPEGAPASKPYDLIGSRDKIELAFEVHDSRSTPTDDKQRKTRNFNSR